MKDMKQDNSVKLAVLEKIDQDIMPLNDLVEIHAFGIDMTEIVTRLQENMHLRQIKAQKNGFSGDSLFSRDDNRFLDSQVDLEIQYPLYQVNYLQDQIFVKPSVEPYSSFIFNFLFTGIRHFFHNLAIYYVNMMAKRQMLFNQAVADILNKLVEDAKVSKQNELQMELVELRRRLVELENKLEHKS